MTAFPAAMALQQLCSTLHIYLVSKCTRRSLSLRIYLRINFAKPADLGTEAGDERSSEEQRDVTDGCFNAAVALQSYTSRLCNITPESSEIRSPGSFQSLFSFRNGANAQTGKQQGCHIFCILYPDYQTNIHTTKQKWEQSRTSILQTICLPNKQ